MSSAYFDTLLRHHAWTITRLLETADLVAPAELEAETLSHGSLFATLRHVADVDQSWGRVVLGEDQLDLARVEEKLVDLASLRAFWLPEVARLSAFVEALPAADLDRDVQPPWKRRPYKIWQIVTHITSHRGEHGNQIGWRLTSLGHSPGELGFMGFVDLERGPLP